MAPKITTESITAENVCQTRKTQRGTLYFRFFLQKNNEGARKGVRKAPEPQSDLRGDAHGGGREKVPGKLGTKGLRRNSAAPSQLTASIVVTKKKSADQQQVETEGTRNGVVAK